MRDMATTDSDWATLKRVLAVGWGENRPLFSVYFVWQLQLNFNFKVKNNWLKLWRHDKTLHFWTALTVLLQICKISPNLVFQWRKTKNKLKKSMQSGSMLWDSVVWWKCPMQGLKHCPFFLERLEFQKMLIKCIGIELRTVKI